MSSSDYSRLNDTAFLNGSRISNLTNCSRDYALCESGRTLFGGLVADKSDIVVNLYIYVEAISFFLILSGNLLVVVSFLRFPSIRKKLPHHWLFHLSLADLLLGLCMPFHVFTFADSPDFKSYAEIPYMCLARYASAQLSIAVSLCVLVALAIHVWLSVKLPYIYNAWISPRRVQLIAGAVWVLCVIYCSLPFFGVHDYRLLDGPDGSEPSAYCDLVKVWKPQYTRFMVASMMILIAILCTVYFLVLRVAWKKVRRESYPTALFNQPRNTKAIKTFVVVTVSTILCYVPFAVCTLLQLRDWNGRKNGPEVNEQDAPLEISAAATTMVLFFHAFLNPIVYSFRLPDFRQAFKLLLRCRWDAAQLRALE